MEAYKSNIINATAFDTSPCCTWRGCTFNIETMSTVNISCSGKNGKTVTPLKILKNRLFFTCVEGKAKFKNKLSNGSKWIKFDDNKCNIV